MRCAVSNECRKPVSTPAANSSLRRTGWPSSSAGAEPTAPASVGSSMMVTAADACAVATLPAYRDFF